MQGPVFCICVYDDLFLSVLFMTHQPVLIPAHHIDVVSRPPHRPEACAPHVWHTRWTLMPCLNMWMLVFWVRFRWPLNSDLHPLCVVVLWTFGHATCLTLKAMQTGSCSYTSRDADKRGAHEHQQNVLRLPVVCIFEFLLWVQSVQNSQSTVSLHSLYEQFTSSPTFPHTPWCMTASSGKHAIKKTLASYCSYGNGCYGCLQDTLQILASSCVICGCM